VSEELAVLIGAPEGRSPERADLAARIAKRDAAREQHAKLTAARARLDIHRLDAARIEAAAALQRVEDEAPQRLVNRLMGLGGPAGTTVDEARRALDQTQQAYDEAEAAAKLLDGEIEETRLRVGVLDLGLSSALGEALQAAPEVAALLARYHEARANLLAIDWALQEVSRAGGIPPSNRFWDSGRPAADFPDRDKLAEPWRTAIAALADDPDAELPG
jgi:hypothetical protein